MPARFQLVIDCQNPELLARFWAAALGSSSTLFTRASAAARRILPIMAG
jgi:hypothetical protein